MGASSQLKLDIRVLILQLFFGLESLKMGVPVAAKIEVSVFMGNELGRLSLNKGI